MTLTNKFHVRVDTLARAKGADCANPTGSVVETRSQQGVVETGSQIAMSTVIESASALVSPRSASVSGAELIANPALKQSAYVLARVASGASKALARAEFQKAVLAKSELNKSRATSLVSALGVRRITTDKAGNPIGIRLNRIGSREQKLSELATALTHAEKLAEELAQAKAMLAKLASQPA